MAKHKQAINGIQHNAHAAPPSTLAAQIVQNQTQPTKHHQQGETATFAQLLHEILHNQVATPETDLETNVKLITVVLEAGVGPLVENNPFSVRTEDLLPQAKDSVAVIQATVKRQPAVLFSLVAPNGPQLVLPLLAKLSAVVGRPHSETIPVSGLLCEIFRSLETSLELWTHAKVLREILQECVDGMLSSTVERKYTYQMTDALAMLETVSPVSDTSCKIPPTRSVTRLWKEVENAISLPYDCQVSINNPLHAFSLALEFVGVIASPSAWRKDAMLKLRGALARNRKKLESSGRLEHSFTRLLSCADNLIVLTDAVQSMADTLPSLPFQAQIAKALTATSRCDPADFNDHILPILKATISAGHFDQLSYDLKDVITSIVRRFQSDNPTLAGMSLLSENKRASQPLPPGREVRPLLNIRQRNNRPRKRIKYSPVESAKSCSIITQKVSLLLSGVRIDNLAKLPSSSISGFASLNEDSQFGIWQGLYDLASLEPSSTTHVVSQLVRTRGVRLSDRSRILSLLTVKSCVETHTDVTYLDLESSSLGQLCLKSLHSHLREVRIVAGQCLPAFLRHDLPVDLLIKNRRGALEYLRMLSDRGALNEQDTLISTWSTVAKACGEKELNLALLRLIDYLAYPNPLISGLAFVEIGELAAARRQSVEEMCRPFWGSIAVSVVNDLQSRPQKARHLCDLLDIEINQFLVMTQQATIPTLVLTKRKDILEKIAAARGKTVTVQDICLQPRTNLTATLALLLVQHGQYAGEAALECLSAVAPGFVGADLAGLIKMDPMLIASDMLKIIGDLPDHRKPKGYQGFHVFASLAEKGSASSKGYSKSSKFIAEFFESHILGIMTHFSQVLEDAQDTRPDTEKVLYLKAIAEMVLLAKYDVGNALPQLRACLQSAMERPPLREAAFGAWLNLLSVLESENIARIIEQTFSLTLRYWSSLPTELQLMSHERIAQLIKNHNHVMQESIMTLPNIGEIPLLSKFAAEIERLKVQQDIESHFKAFTTRFKDESKIVVMRAVEEFVPFLEEHQGFIHDSAIGEQPTTILSDLVRVLLDTTVKYASDDDEIANKFSKILGMIGCLDPNRIEALRKRRSKVILQNFEKASEVVDWAVIFLDDVLVKVFRSVSNARAQGFVAYVIQELLRFCGFNDPNALQPRTSSQVPSPSQRFSDLPEHVRIILTPLISSKYVVTTNNANAPNRAYPSFAPAQGHSMWLRQLVYDLMWKANGENARMVFPLIARLIRGHDLSIANFMLPYAVMNVTLGGTAAEMKAISDEFLAVLNFEPSNDLDRETVKLCSESVFASLDYMSIWLREKKKVLGENRSSVFRNGNTSTDFDEAKDMGQIATVEKFLASVPAQLIATRAVLCGSYSRALLHWEQHIRQLRPLIPSARPFTRNTTDARLYDELQQIYSQIDEPDGLEGISAHLTFLSEEQQATQHAKAGRWTAAQTWYEMQLKKSPGDIDLEEKLLSCLRETGRYEPLLKYADAFYDGHINHSQGQVDSKLLRLLPISAEAHWMSGDLDGMAKRLDVHQSTKNRDFNVGLAKILRSLAKGDNQCFEDNLRDLRKQVTQGMTLVNTNSIQSSREDLRKLHVLYETEALQRNSITPQCLDKRLAVLGSYVSDKQYILGIRRAITYAQKTGAGDTQIGSSWLTTAKLARKSGNTESAYNAVLRASDCDSPGAKLEEARLLWHDGHQRHAIQALEAAIDSGIFQGPQNETHTPSDESQPAHKQNPVYAKALLLLAKWLDASGQRQAKDMTEKYQFAARSFQRWEKGHYSLGKHYQKLLEAEKALPKNRQTPSYLSGDMTRLVIENQTRSIAFGSKYWHQTIPKIFTLWLDLGSECMSKARNTDDQNMLSRKMKSLEAVNRLFAKYFERVPSYVFYSAMPQLISRITHPNPEVWKVLSGLLTKIVTIYPNQALWSILAVVKSTDQVRVDRGYEILNRVKDPKNKAKSSFSLTDLRSLIAHSQKLTDGLLNACETQVKDRVREVSLSKDLGFNHKLAPSQLVVPIELTLTATGPTDANLETIRQHKPFVQGKITINAFLDEVLVLSSLQRPRKVTVRGSDGKTYGLLCKPKDDLRKDQRLMEFNGVINRALKRDGESSKRRLYIKTYAVTPLSEESGTIEWVEGIKPLRDILLNIYARKGITPQYQQIRNILQEASESRAKLHLFKDKVLPMFPASLHEWFTEVYPESDVWFAARLRYARSAAVTSMTGHVLGLGDRHGENILLEEGSGGVFHVDFNCLFDKGLTFEKPELVPFRLTHNMVDAMGPYGYEGPFRKSSELTLELLRQNKDTLMTVLETFLYDPTTDFVGKKKRSTPGVPETPQEILDSVDSKLKGLLGDEKIPLSVEGYVDALVRQATDHSNLAAMYIGWCAFL